MVTRFVSSTIQFHFLAVTHWNANDFNSISSSVVYNSIVWQENLTRARHQNIDIILNVERVSIVSFAYLVNHSLSQYINSIEEWQQRNKKKKSILNWLLPPLLSPFLRLSLNFPLIGQQIDIVLMVFCTTSFYWHFDIILSMPFLVRICMLVCIYIFSACYRPWHSAFVVGVVDVNFEFISRNPNWLIYLP